ncbi:MAG: S9 family peptidase [Chitinophagaceae bacterium]|nr:MAG: S9 family peptidase [Chitinophagaceae bacterium]
MRGILLLFFFLPFITIAQDKQITLEDIYQKGTFRSEFVPGFTAEDYSSLFDPKQVKDDAGKVLNTSEYVVSPDRKQIIFSTNKESIYRHSSKANVYIYDVATKKTTSVNKGKVLHPSFSPDGKKLAYVYDNNLYLYDIASGKTKAITTDGKWNHFINGNSDWVYEEEFSFTKAYEWSPDGAYLAFYKFDERPVKEFNMTIFDDQHNKDYRYKYPKAGDSNSIVSIHVYNVASEKTIPAQFEQGDIYIPRIKWTTTGNKLVVYWMNRLQNQLKLLLTDANTGTASTLYDEKNKYYVDINDDWWFLKDGKHFLFGSEMNGWYRLYMYGIDGKTKTEITKMKADVADINGVDEKNRLVYYTVAYPTPMDRNLFVSDFEGKKTTQLTTGNGWHRAEFNNDFSQFYDYYSNVSTPQTVTLFDVKNTGGKIMAVKNKVVSENSKLKTALSQYKLGQSEFIRIPNSKGDTLNGWMLKPANFDASKKYPVLFVNYGGPGSQYVVNRFGMSSLSRYLWEQMLAQKGFIVVNVDNTGTGFRGEEFKKKTYLQLGKYEIEDQIDAAKWLSKLSYVDPKNIGHWGWSYGGFMSSLAITKGADVFTGAVAVAPVTSWRYYDNVYTERFMRTPQENAKGYDENSPINHVNKIRGKYLLIHGTGDDNVHFQNSAQMIKALVKANVDFETMYYPDKNHSISGMADNTSYHLWGKMTNWILQNLGNENVDKTRVGNNINAPKAAF